MPFAKVEVAELLVIFKRLAEIPPVKVEVAVVPETVKLPETVRFPPTVAFPLVVKVSKEALPETVGAEIVGVEIAG